MLSLVLPKGSLERATLDLFDAADLTVRRSSDRDYHASVDDPRIERVRFLRPQEIPSYIEQGLFDFGITGRDWIAETGADVASLGELQYSKATSDPVRVVLAVPDGAPWSSASDLPEGVRISTEFPSLTRRYLDAAGVKAVVIASYGATEAKVPDIVDAIVDLTETGSSLRKNGLRILDTLLTSYTEKLIANPAAFADPVKRSAMEDGGPAAARVRSGLAGTSCSSSTSTPRNWTRSPRSCRPCHRRGQSLARGDMTRSRPSCPRPGSTR